MRYSDIWHDIYSMRDRFKVKIGDMLSIILFLFNRFMYSHVDLLGRGIRPHKFSAT